MSVATRKKLEKDSKVLVGTCSWTDPTLLESGWYPADVAKKPDERLRYYAERFALVENEHRINQAVRGIKRALPKLG